MNSFLFSILTMLVASSALMAIVPVDAADFSLGIFGNANMDDTVDEIDIEYVQGIIDGTNVETELADTNLDGKIDAEDIVQIGMIIRCEAEMLNILDGNGEPVAVKMPVERIIVLYKDSPEVLRTLDAADRIVGISDYSESSNVLPHI